MTSATTHSPASVTARAEAAAPRAKKVRGREERSTLASVALHGTLILASLVAAFPVVWIVFISLGPKTAWQSPGEVLGNLSLDNYAKVLTDTDFPQWFGASVIVAGGTTVLGVFLAASAGYAVSRMRFPGHRQLMWSFLVTQMFPMAVLIVPLYELLARFDLIDNYLGLILTYATTAVPFCAWMMKGYFDTIPHEIDEAGRVDGLTPFGTFWRLIVPLAKPGLAVTAFYSFLTAWGEVAYASQFMGADHYTLAVGIRTFATESRADWAMMTAASVLILIPATLVFLLVQRNLVSGLTAGGTKS
ncbi:sugar ABC transporter permease [Streptomyces kanamyceticus]|uniref:Carbohydrate ABC transporter permease n=1 Tax=Streptomyces kanamyceticus TaxID=1967 RepID=A0A5J6GL18_STRKN|nr:carbohydrate ABC transporter permease [Streptomyces kanamyceticus]QEU94791.1 carbohydrate ABC transporter permease [Streptomyces kanamyceticus]